VQQPDFEKEQQELLQIHKADREAHFTTDIDALLSNTSDQFITVQSGTIDTLPRPQLQSIFKTSFEGVTYYEWDDLNPPIIRISRGGTMAWMITRLKVRYVRQDTSGNEEEREFVYAGIMTYEKLDGKWVRTANVSTFE
jgi:hypothetical protein